MPAQDKNFHIFTEIVAVFICAPILIYIGFEQTNVYYKYFLIIFAILSIFVDGYLLSQYSKW